MYARSWSACGDWATFSGILQVTHMTCRSICGSEARGCSAAAVGASQTTSAAAARRSVREVRISLPAPARLLC